MKSLHARAAAALLLSIGLAACGGKASFQVGGTIVDKSNPLAGATTPDTSLSILGAGLELANGGSTLTPAKGATTFTFPTSIDYGTDYNVLIQKQPQHITCAVTNGSGSAGHVSEISATVTCAVNAYTVGGTIKNLSVDGLILANGSTTATVSPALGATSFTFPSSVPYNTAYSVTVAKTPPGLACDVTNDAGTMQDAAVTNVVVECHAAP